ncbi:MAG: ATP-binding protein [Pseudomonadota bacterium]|nr:ATP-binding protein [Pseudomonadota bacterium]
MAERFSDQFDFQRCEDEPIRTPGAIQSHGAVVLLDAESYAVTGYSDNAADMITRATGLPVGNWSSDSEPLSSLVLPIKEAIRNGAAWPLRQTHFRGTRLWQTTVSKRGRRLILELETGRRQVDTTVGDLAQLIAQVKSARSINELVQTASVAVRSITGFDRVMVYKFAEDWHGEVIAESLASDMPGYLGLHFPASDIPAQARALYLENEIRMIADVDAPIIPITSLSTLAEDTNPDLSDCSLRAVSPIHLQYLRNMGVAASMSISLVRDNKLWGLIACHHREPRYITVDARLAAKLVGDVLSMCLRLVEDSDLMKARLRQNLRQTAMIERFVQSDELAPALAQNAEDLRQLFRATGFAVVDGQRVYRSGQCPDDADLLTLAGVVRAEMQSNLRQIHAQSSWPAPLFDGHLQQAAGLLAMAPSADYEVMALWLRAEEPEEITWAGAIQKVEDDPLNPRASFERWSEQRRGKARAWTSWELDAAEDLHSALQKVALRQLERLQTLSENLARSNQDLEDFAFIASHDLQEPLRKIEAFSSMIDEELEEKTPDTETVRDYLHRITSASGRLRALVGDLLTYSRVGRLEYDDSECDWQSLIRKSADLLGVEDRTDASIEIAGTFPVTRSSPVLLRMVFQNLLSNALKYSDPARHNTIRVTGEQDAGGRWNIRVQDAGIGFDPEMSEAIFKPFLRLNSKSHYPGSGIGLAIVRKAASRLGARVSATSEPGQGSEFRLILDPAD